MTIFFATVIDSCISINSLLIYLDHFKVFNNDTIKRGYIYIYIYIYIYSHT